MNLVVNEVDWMIENKYHRYKRLNLSELNFANEKEIDKDAADVVAPVRWNNNILRGDRSVVIKAVK